MNSIPHIRIRVHTYTYPYTVQYSPHISQGLHFPYTLLIQKLCCNFSRLGIGVACVCYFATSLLLNNRLVAQLRCKLDPRQHAKTKRRTLFRMCIAGSCINSSYDSHTAQRSASWSSTVKFVWNCRSECNIAHTGYNRAHTEPHSEVFFQTVVPKTMLTISTSCLRLAPSC